MEGGKRKGGGYFLKAAPESIFDKVFNAVDPWADKPNLSGSDFRGTMFGDGFKGTQQQQAQRPRDCVVTLECTLEEFYQGSLKNFSYSHTQV